MGMGRLHLLLIITIGIFTSLERGECLNKVRFCRIMCARGQGGDACRCNAVHFAGKRTSETSINPPQRLSNLLSLNNDKSRHKDLAYLVHVIASLHHEDKLLDSAETTRSTRQGTRIHGSRKQMRTKKENELTDLENIKKIERLIHELEQTEEGTDS